MATLTKEDQKLQELMHRRDTMEKVVRELLTAVDPQTNAAMMAMLDLIEAERAVNLAR